MGKNGNGGKGYVEAGGGNPNNRAAEYDTMNNRYARFLIEEILPEVGKTQTDPLLACLVPLAL